MEMANRSMIPLSNLNSNVTPHHSDMTQNNPFQNVYPTLIQCFLIILFGYGAGRGRLISPLQARGLEIYAVTAALPASILKFMIKLDFANVDWALWLALLTSKLILFVLVIVITLLLLRPYNFGRAGIYGIFVTQSNDLALGLPLFSALYEDSSNDFCQYIFLLMPVTFGLINPLGFFLLELEKSRHSETSPVSKWKIAWTVLKEVTSNPLVYTVIIGLVINFLSGHQMPNIINNCLEVLANSFGAIALFCLGLSMVGSMQKFTGVKLILSLVLIITKCIVLPFICKETVYVFLKYNSHRNNSEIISMSTFGFLYGTLPTAPTVAIFAAKYGAETDTIVTSMVLGTILSAPIMFVSAKMIMIRLMTEMKEFAVMISKSIVDVSILSIVCCLWVFMVFVVGKKIINLPHRWTSCLVLSQLLAAICPLVVHSQSMGKQAQHCIMGLVLFSYISVILWTAVLSMTLAYIRWKGANTYRSSFTIAAPLIGWGFSGVLSTALILVVNDRKDMEFDLLNIDNFLHQPILSVTLIVCLILSLGITLAALIFIHRQDRYCRCEHKLRISDDFSSFAGNSIEQTREICSVCRKAEEQYSVLSQVDSKACHKTCRGETYSRSHSHGSNNEVHDIEDISFVATNIGIEEPEIVELREFEDNLINERLLQDGGAHQLNRHIILLILLSMAHLLGIFLFVWHLLKNTDGIYFEMKFLVSILTFGQGFLSFAVFGFNKELFISSAMKRFLKYHIGCLNRRIKLAPIENVDQADLKVCLQFQTHHLERCKEELVRKLRFHLKSYNNVFRGDEFVSWLINFGLAEDRDAAVNYGNSLLQGRVLKHCVEEHHFKDLPYFYTFTETTVSHIDSD